MLSFSLLKIYSTRGVTGTHFHGECWCPDCLRWWCSPSGTEPHPQSQWRGSCRAYHTGHCRHCIAYCVKQQQKRERGVNEKKKKTDLGEKHEQLLIFLPHPGIICPLPNSFQRICANKFTAWYKAISHAKSLIFWGASFELMREWLTVLTSETKQQWYVQ